MEQRAHKNNRLSFAKGTKCMAKGNGLIPFWFVFLLRASVCPAFVCICLLFFVSPKKSSQCTHLVVCYEPHKRNTCTLSARIQNSEREVVIIYILAQWIRYFFFLFRWRERKVLQNYLLEFHLRNAKVPRHRHIRFGWIEIKQNTVPEKETDRSNNWTSILRLDVDNGCLPFHLCSNQNGSSIGWQPKKRQHKIPITSCVYNLHDDRNTPRTFSSLRLVNNEIFHVLTCSDKVEVWAFMSAPS